MFILKLSCLVVTILINYSIKCCLFSINNHAQHTINHLYDNSPNFMKTHNYKIVEQTKTARVQIGILFIMIMGQYCKNNASLNIPAFFHNTNTRKCF